MQYACHGAAARQLQFAAERRSKNCAEALQRLALLARRGAVAGIEANARRLAPASLWRCALPSRTVGDALALVEVLRMLKLNLFLGGLLAALAGCADVAPDATPQTPSAAAVPASSRAPTASRNVAETARLNEWLDARYEEQLDFSPMERTRLGRKDAYDRLDDVSEAAQDQQLAWRRATVEELERTFDYDVLDPEGKTSYDLWKFELEQRERASPFRRRHYLFTQMDGPHTGLPQFLINFHRVDERADMEAYVARIGEAARVLGQYLERAQRAAEEGVRPPRFAYDVVLEQARAVVSGAPFAGGRGESPLWADAQAKIAALVTAGKVDEARAAELRAATETALVDRLKPSYDTLIAWLEADLPPADEAATGVWKLPDGAAFYAERLAARTTTSLTADEIHEIGLREVARIRTEMEAIKNRVGFDGALEEFFTHMRSDPRFFFPNTDEGREGYLAAARDYLAAIEERLPDYFGLLPKGELVVRRVEAFREEPGAAQHYVQGTPDGSRPAVYYAHLIDMNAMPKPEMEVVAYHEGLPGHHMQVAIAQERTGIPLFRTQAFFGAYVEGWALYAELLAKEMGAYDDPYSDFGRLGAEIWRAIRLVLDTGLHSKGWTEADAVAYFMANSPASEGQIRSEVRRYIVWPAQATSYKIGMLEILRLRAKAEAALGDRFDIRGFHDAILGGGALPLSILERRVDGWIAAQ